MTSGNFIALSIDSITILREDRQRKELKNIPELADSLSRIGLIHPIVVTADNVLVAGERRLTAAKSLGWTSIPAQRVEDLDPLTLHAIELEENIKRHDLTWQEECLAVEQYHNLRRQQHPEQTMEETGKELGFSRTDVSEKLSVAKEITKGNTRVSEADKYSTARNIVRRDTERKNSSDLTAITKTAVSILSDTIPVEEPEETKPVVPLLNEDFHEWAAGYCGLKFNMIHCDFPYGVGMHNSDQGSGQEFGTYEDDEDVYWKLLDSLKMSMSNVVADSAHLIFWFSMDFYEETMLRLTDMGWKVNPFPLIWLKSDNTGIIPDAQRGPRRIYETAFFASRGDRLLTARGARANAFSHPGRGKSIHMNEKPVPMLTHFMGMCVDEYSIVLDPTAGSANALKAAQNLGAATVLGLEKSQEFFSLATENFHNTEGV